MKKILLLLIAFTTLSLTAQVTIFEDGFETYGDFEIANIGSWTQIDLDGNVAYGSSTIDFANEGYTGTAIVFNSSATVPVADSMWNARTGDKGLYFFAATNNPNGTAANDDYMITPQIDLTNATGSSMTMWAKTLTDNWGNERFEVLLSTTGNNQADFTVNLSGGVIDDTPIDYTEYTYDLSAYDGQQIYIAIHYLGLDTFVFMVDDFKVEAQNVASTTESTLASNISIFPSVVSDLFTVKNSGNIALISANIFDVNGRLIVSHDLNNLVGEKSINVSNLTAGIYFVEIQSDNDKIIKKIIKK